MSDFKSVVFSGGGSRCLWQVGFWESLAGQTDLKPEIVAGVSAGAAMAGMIMAGKGSAGLKMIKDATSKNRKNFYISNTFRQEPVFPQFPIYRNTLIEILDSETIKKIKGGPEIRILIARPPAYLGPRSGTFIGLMAYLVEKHTKGPVHPELAFKLGYRPEVIRLNDCSSAGEMADLIICSSCTPPFVPIMKWNGRISLDGGIIDNVPVCAVGEDESRGNMLILMSRQYRKDRIPHIKGRVYVEPSETPAIGKWDYTNPEGMQRAYDTGRFDGDVFAEKYKNGEV